MTKITGWICIRGKYWVFKVCINVFKSARFRYFHTMCRQWATYNPPSDSFLQCDYSFLFVFDFVFVLVFSLYLYFHFFLYLWMWTLSTCKLRMVNPVIHNEVTGSVWPDDQWSAIIVRIQWWYKYKKCSDTNEKYEIQIYKYKLITLVYHRRSPSSSLSLSP